MSKDKKLKRAARKVVETDHKVAETVGARRETLPVRIVGLLAEAGDQPELITASAGTVVVGIVSRRPDLIRGGARMLAAHLVATGVKTMIKHRFDRHRPAAAEDSGDHHFRKGESHEHDENSFPSGHTAGAVAVARAASRDIEGAGTPAGLAATAIAAAQPATGSHFLTDVVAGAAIGWVSEAVVSAIFDRVEPAIENAVQRLVGSGAAQTAADR
jgi:membrane-associated phospholipid phosphatase